MGAPKGNQFWKQRSKHGRDKLFSSPEMLWDASCEYFEWCDTNPLKEEEIVKVKGTWDIATTNKMRAYTLTGLCLFLGCSTEYLRHFEENNKDSKDFMPIITRIREVIYTQKFEGASAGLLNANIIARDLGLADKREQNVKVEQPLFPDE
ncbi:MAG: DNA-packaging protein [Flavobacteriales bacterium]|jgi:hypothetical protein|nr:DNA-packaging protein [Flavobacteriales bacterium]